MSGRDEWRPLDFAFRRKMVRFASTVSSIPDLPPQIPTAGQGWHAQAGAGNIGRRPTHTRRVSDPLDKELREQDVELIAPHKSNRKKPPTQDGRCLRRYKRRWKVERLFAWLQNFRRILVRYEYHDENYLGFVHLGCMLILLRAYF
jgi:transposase